MVVIFFFQAEDGIRAADVTGVQTCALPILVARRSSGTYPHVVRALDRDGRGGTSGSCEPALNVRRWGLIALSAALVVAPLSAQRRATRRPPTRTTVSPAAPGGPGGAGAAGGAGGPIPTPRSVLGFEPGDDRKLVEWPVLVRYFEALAKASDRIDYRELGKTTLGAPFIALVISSPQNLRRLDHYRQLNAQLADPRTLRSSRAARDAQPNGKTIVLVTSSIHSTEVGGHLSPVALAYRLATDTSAATRAILDNVILWLVPSLNPDGVTIVAR